MTVLQQATAFVAVTDLDRAEQFYGSVLGLDLRDERPFALSAELGGTHVRITLVDELTAAPYTVLGFIVADIEVAVDDLVASGVEFRRYDGMGQDGRGVWTAPGGTRVAWFTDPDGNNLSISAHSG